MINTEKTKIKNPMYEKESNVNYMILNFFLEEKSLMKHVNIS